jgi:processive 1,2-diacylglycerol beta-glucosyltransferase
VRAADALVEAFAQRHPTIHVEHWDALAHLPAWFSRTYRKGYVTLVDRLPMVWRKLYEATDRTHSAVGNLLTRLAGRRLVADVVAFKPDLVLCTHFLAPEVLASARAKGRFDAPVEIVVTDHDAHSSWAWPGVRHAYVASALVAGRFRLKHGFAAAALTVTGVPVRAAFAEPRDEVAVRARYGLDAGRPTVLFLSGGFVVGPLLDSITGLWSERPDLQVLAVCGTNARLKRRVERLDRPPGALLHALGFVEDVADLMSVADVVVAKSGGVTTAECMAMGRPLLIAAQIAGQEERNADAVLAAGAGLKALSSEEVRWHALRLVTDRWAHSRMQEAARAFGRPHAAADVADAVAAKVARPDALAGPRFHGAP